MADITIKFPRSNYPSLQVGDTAYYVDVDNVQSTGGFTSTVDGNEEDNLTILGVIKSIDYETTLTDGTLTTTVVIAADASAVPPTASDFVLFSKDNRVNLSSLLGYYAAVRFVNDSTAKSEIFSTACEISESSK